MKNKIAFYIPKPNYGGVTRVLLNLARELSKDREVCVITYKGFAFDNPVLPKLKNIEYLEIPSKSSLGALFTLGFCIRKYKLTHIITASPITNCIAVISKLVFPVNVKVIVTEHTMVSVEATHRRRKVYLLLPFLISYFYPKADHIVSISNGIKDDLIGYAGLDRESIRVINNLVIGDDFTKLKNAQVSHPFFQRGEKVVVFVGRLEAVKNPLLLIKAFRILLRSCDVRLMVIGDGPMEKEVQECVSMNRISNKVSFLGYVANPIPYILRSDVLALTSKWEGMPGVLIEALACNTPVVATDCAPGVREIFSGKVYGKIVENYLPEKFASALYEVLNGGVELDDLQLRSEDFSATSVVKDYLSIIS